MKRGAPGCLAFRGYGNFAWPCAAAAGRWSDRFAPAALLIHNLLN